MALSASTNDLNNCVATHDILQAIVDRGLQALGYTLFIVDEPCFVGRDASGVLIENHTTWPNGLKAFSQFLEERNMVRSPSSLMF